MWPRTGGFEATEVQHGATVRTTERLCDIPMSDAFSSPNVHDPRVLGVLFEAKLQEWNIPYSYDPAYPIAGLKNVAAVQARGDMNIGNAERVEEYRQHMQAGAVFPPLVVMDPDMLVDGNTRLIAARKLKMTTFPVFVARFSTTGLARTFGAAMNQKNGARLSSDEAREAAQILLAARHESEAVAREVGYSPTQVGKWKAEMLFEEKANATGLPNASAVVKKPQQHQLAQVKSHPVFEECVRTVIDLRLPPKETTQLVKVAKEATSDADALQALRKMRAELTPSGPIPHRSHVPAALQRFRLVAPQMLKFAEVPMDFLETDPERRETSIVMWRQIRDLADRVVVSYGE